METYRFDDIIITINKKGSSEFSKVSYPIRYGRFAEIKTHDRIFQFNLNGEIKYIQGRGGKWPDLTEWLKRTIANDWVYYSTDGYGSVYDFTGEYYYPNLLYPSNSLIGRRPFENSAVSGAIKAWQQLLEELNPAALGQAPQPFKDFIALVNRNDAKALNLKQQKFHTLLDGPVTVLPPDTRHVDYEVIPVNVADGCLYNCSFCRVKSGRNFLLRSRGSILRQIRRLKDFYAQDLANYNSVFLGRHDALYAGQEIVGFASLKAYEIFKFERSNLKCPRLFLFGSVDSMLKADETFFELLNRLPFYTYINLGLESADPETLAVLQKPVSAEAVKDAFSRMLDINKKYENIEITANFVLGRNLPEGHLPSIMELLSCRLNHFCSKGTVYLSPMSDIKTKREVMGQFLALKNMRRLPVYIYLIQRL